MEGLAEEWLRLDRDPSTWAEVKKLLDDRDHAELERRLGSRLEFGTAGLRAQMGAGFSRINGLTIIQTTQGLAKYLLSTHEDAKSRGVVIGFDGRHGSQKFARLAAAAFSAQGINVWFCESTVHTPIIPFGVKHFKAVAGVMITASHNPAQDNGYKVYAANGCQINSEASMIAKSILDSLEPVTWDTSVLESSDLFVPRRDNVVESYLHGMREYAKSFAPIGANDGFPRFVYTPMHGVGLPYMQAALKACSGSVPLLQSMSIVEEQSTPDPDFPTVRYPNPEEDGALSLAKSTADARGIALIVANDPDADRFAVAEKIDGRWIQLSGDQVGILLGSFLLSQISKDPGSQGGKAVMLASAVSSSMLKHICHDKGVAFEETLTGFKWLGNRALELSNRGESCMFAYEEALGYMFPKVVLDKDGVTAAMIFLRACSTWKSPSAELDNLYRKYGYFVTLNTYWRSPSSELTLEFFQGIRRSCQPHPESVADRKVLRWRDLTTCYDSAAPDAKPDLPCSKTTQMITCWLGGSEGDSGMRFTIRTSGTEPKIKMYLECQAKTGELAQANAIRAIQLISKSWFVDDRLKIEEKHRDLIQ